jgi:hypothetical protein
MSGIYKYCCQETKNPQSVYMDCNPCEQLKAPCNDLNQTLCENPAFSDFCTWSGNKCTHKLNAPPFAKTITCPSPLPDRKVCGHPAKNSTYKYCCEDVDNPLNKWVDCHPCNQSRKACGSFNTENECTNSVNGKYCEWAHNQCFNKKGAPSNAKEIVPCLANFSDRKLCNNPAGRTKHTISESRAEKFFRVWLPLILGILTLLLVIFFFAWLMRREGGKNGGNKAGAKNVEVRTPLSLGSDTSIRIVD